MAVQVVKQLPPVEKWWYDYLCSGWNIRESLASPTWKDVVTVEEFFKTFDDYCASKKEKHSYNATTFWSHFRKYVPPQSIIHLGSRSTVRFDYFNPSSLLIQQIQHFKKFFSQAIPAVELYEKTQGNLTEERQKWILSQKDMFHPNSYLPKQGKNVTPIHIRVSFDPPIDYEKENAKTVCLDDIWAKTCGRKL